MTKLIQPSFAKGEIAPDLYGRVDIRDYAIALKRARNMIVHQFGSISNRPGTQYLCNTKYADLPPRLLPFQFKSTDTHVIEFGHEYIRILRNDALVESSPGVTFELATTYQQDELRDVQFTQTGDVMTIVHPSHPPRELQRHAINDWELVDIIFRPTIDFPQTLATSGGSLGVDSFWTVTAIAKNGEESLPAITATAHVITAINQANPATVTSAGHGFLNGDIIHLQDIVGMTQLNDRRFIATNVTANTFDLLGENSTTYDPYISGGNAFATFIFNTNSTGVVLTWDAVVDAVRYRVFKQSSGVYGFVASVAGQTYTSTGSETPDLGDTPPELVEPFLGTGNRPRAVGFYQQRMVMGGSNNKPDTSYFSVIGNFHNFSHASPIRASDGFSATLASGEVNEIRHYTSVKDLFVNTSGAEWAINSGSLDTRFSVDTIRQDLQTNWGANNMPPINIAQTILFCEPSGNRIKSTSFAFEHDHYITQDVSLMVRHFLAGKQLLEWAFVKSPDPIIYMIRDDGQVLSLTYNEEQQVLAWTTWDTQGSYESVCAVRPSIDDPDPQAYFVIKRFINGSTIRFIERTHKREFTDVRDCFFVDAGLSYDNPCHVEDVTLLNPLMITCSGHGFSNGDEIDAIDFIWQSTIDEFGNETQPDQLNGNRYTVSNVTANTFTIDVDGTAFSLYREGGIVRKAVQNITAAHLPNTTVSVLADGNVISGVTLDGTGSATLFRKFSRIHLGLKYISDMETLKVEHLSRTVGSVQGAITNIAFVTVRFKDSRGLFIGSDTENLIEMKFRDQEDMADPTILFTGDKEISLLPGSTSNGNIFLRQLYPLPMTILALIPDTDWGDR